MSLTLTLTPTLTPTLTLTLTKVGGGEAEAAADGPESKESAPDHSTISAIILEQLAAQRAVSDAGVSGESAAL